MQPEIPFRVIGKLGSCDVGTVWSAVDEARGVPVTVAVLDHGPAGERHWRDAFAAAAHTMVSPQTGQPRPYLGADFNAPAPWVAYQGGAEPGAEHVFVSLGRTYLPAMPSTPPTGAHPTQPISAQPAVAQQQGQPTMTQPVYGTPISGAPLGPPNGHAPNGQAPQFPQPVSAQPNQPISAQPNYPVSAQPNHPVSGQPNYPVSGQPNYPVSGQPADYGQQPADPFGLGGGPRPHYFGEGAHDPYGGAVAPAKKGNRLWLFLAIGLVVVLVAGGVVFGVTQLGGGGETDVTAGSTTSAGPDAGGTASLPPPAPVQPGLEPPRIGDWPDKWPKYTDKDPAQAFTLDGLDFAPTLPTNWECTAATVAGAVVSYNCGFTMPDGQKVGGEITVRECPPLCDEARRTELRKTEEAWGAQWRFAGDYATIAESPDLDGNKYGLVVLGYYRSNPDAAIDRQLVLRMTGEANWTDEIRKIANGVHDAAKL